ncbi:MAG TPA: hypothetical protein VKM54_18685 [Myxococcota bacterium]|nr:hypothetical protein [Myxococcota bacterium]
MSTPYEFEKAPAAWTAAQVAAVREAAAELRAARLRVQNPPVRRIQRFGHPLAGYGALLACILLFGPILTCAGFALPVLTCAGMAATHAGVSAPMASPQHPEAPGLDVTREPESAPESWYSYRGRDGVTVYAFGVPPLGSTVIGLDQGDHRLSVAGPNAGSGAYTGIMPPSTSSIAAPMRGWSRHRYH